MKARACNWGILQVDMGVCASGGQRWQNIKGSFCLITLAESHSFYRLKNDLWPPPHCRVRFLNLLTLHHPNTVTWRLQQFKVLEGHWNIDVWARCIIFLLSLKAKMTQVCNKSTTCFEKSRTGVSIIHDYGTMLYSFIKVYCIKGPCDPFELLLQWAQKIMFPFSVNMKLHWNTAQNY